MNLGVPVEAAVAIVSGIIASSIADRIRPELGEAGAVRWSVPDPVPVGDPDSFDAALAQLTDRVERLAPRPAAVS